MANEEEAKKPEAVEATEAPATAEAAAPAPVAAKEETPPSPTPVAGSKKSKKAGSDRIHGLGRRKTAVARVALVAGSGNWVVNGRTMDDYFPRPTLQQSIQRPLVLAELQGQYDVHVRVVGGGPHGQADAVRDMILATKAFDEPDILTDRQDLDRIAMAVRR